MISRVAEALSEKAGLGQIIADEIVVLITELVEGNSFLKEHSGLDEVKALFIEQSKQPGITVEEVRETYGKRLHPVITLIQQETGEAGIRSTDKGMRIVRMPPFESFDEIESVVKQELNEKVPEDVQLSAADSIIAGDISLRDIFLPFKRGIREEVLKIMDYSVDLDEEVEVERRSSGESFILEKCGEEIFDILYLENDEIERLVKTGELDPLIANAIISVRSDVDQLLGESMLDRASRLAKMKAAHLGVFDESSARFDREEDGLTQDIIRVTRLLQMRARPVPRASNPNWSRTRGRRERLTPHPSQ
ncbi:MAG: hypothetical protein WC285_05785 [Candidatus Gracilibacteria bacterium]|jgi:hypothetical protein